MSFTYVVLRRALTGGVAVTAAVALSACGGHDDSAGSGMGHGSGKAPAVAASPGASSGPVNATDVMFAQMMIPHHRQAVEMAAMASSRASDPDVKTLAAKIAAAQQPEIDAMTGWLTAWGVPAAMPGASAEAMPGMDHGPMPGMMTAADMAKLGKAEGAEFDRQFLTMMIAHHEGAVTMARQESAEGADSAARALADKITADQQAEIATMKGILARR